MAIVSGIVGNNNLKRVVRCKREVEVISDVVLDRDVCCDDYRF